jgi:hypothetical protein
MRWVVAGFALGYIVLGPLAYDYITCCPGKSLVGPG